MTLAPVGQWLLELLAWTGVVVCLGYVGGIIDRWRKQVRDLEARVAALEAREP
jgi:hypothetical protein